jgi:hypothetical protein
LETFDGFLSPPGENDEREVIGNPSFEVALQQLFPTKESDGLPPETTADLNRDSVAVRDFARFLNPHDSAMQAIVRKHDLSVRNGSPYEWFGVAPVDTVDQRVGIREGVLRIYVRESDKPSAQWIWFELLFVRSGPSETWVQVKYPDDALIDAKRSAFHAAAGRAETEIRGLFRNTVSMAQWWATRREVRGGS